MPADTDSAPRRTRRRFLGELGRGLAAAGAALTGGPLLASRQAAAQPLLPPTLREAEALFVVLADTHSAYERYPQMLAVLDGLRAAHPRVPLAILFNGDLFERGSAVALRGQGRIDLALVQELALRAPVVFNLGNHEASIHDLAGAAALLRASGARVITNAVDTRTGQSFAPPSALLELAGHRVAVAGMATDDLATYRAAVRETLRVPSGPEYAAAHLPRLLGGAEPRVVLSHTGTLDDRRMLPGIPDGTLVVGGHDHLRYAHRAGRTLYLHTGSWGDTLTVVALRRGAAGAEWTYEAVPIPLDAPGDIALAARIRAEEHTHLTPEETAVVGHTERELPLREAALFAVAAVRDVAGADVAMIGNTTFGAGLPAGPVTRHRFDAFVRFDNELQRFEAGGDQLREILLRANQFGHVPFERRTGEFLVASALETIDPARRYTVATDAWIRRNAERYLGRAPEFTPLPGLMLKAVVATRLAP
jgi:5'-nucleotidase / UDP-sugar diphosphatase